MHKLIFTVLLVHLSFNHTIAQTEVNNPLAKYCKSNSGEENKAEVIMVSDTPKLRCNGTPMSDQAFYEIARMELDPDNKAPDNDAFFAAPAWENYLKKGILRAFARAKKVDPSICAFNKDATQITCTGFEPEDMNFAKEKENYEKRYEEGSKLFAADTAPKLKEIYAFNIAMGKFKDNKTPTGPLGTEFWESLEPNNQVVLKETEQQKSFNSYMWNDLNKDNVDKYGWKSVGIEQPYQIIIKDPNSEPLKTVNVTQVTVDKEIKVNPVQDQQIVIPEIKTEEVGPNGEVVEEKIVEKEKEQEQVEVKEEAPKSDCKDKLKQEIAKLLEDDKKNIIGLQFELTVLKMASAATFAKSKTLEGLIKSKEAEIKKNDTDIIAKMNAMYKTHGLPEDAQSIKAHLHEKSATANYFQKDKRFFNQDSSAFLLAYQALDANSGIKDSDVSVLWFMDKVSEKAKAKTPVGNKVGAYSIEHNMTNLSTRIAQYTGAVDSTKTKSKDELDAMILKQKSKIDAEFLALIENFKQNPATLACYNEIFGEGESECNLGRIEASFSELLAINSKIPSTDLVTLESNLKGGLDKTRFKISKYVD